MILTMDHAFDPSQGFGCETWKLQEGMGKQQLKQQQQPPPHIMWMQAQAQVQTQTQTHPQMQTHTKLLEQLWNDSQAQKLCTEPPFKHPNNTNCSFNDRCTSKTTATALQPLDELFTSAAQEEARDLAFFSNNNPFEPTPLPPGMGRRGATAESSLSFATADQPLCNSPELIFDSLKLNSDSMKGPSIHAHHKSLGYVETRLNSNAANHKLDPAENKRKSADLDRASLLLTGSPSVSHVAYSDGKPLNFIHSSFGYDQDKHETFAKYQQGQQQQDFLPTYSQDSPNDASWLIDCSAMLAHQDAKRTKHSHGDAAAVPGTSKLDAFTAQHEMFGLPAMVEAPSQSQIITQQLQMALSSTIACLPASSKPDASQDLKVSADVASQSVATSDSEGASDDMLRLRHLMAKSEETQKALQEWDKKNGLPKSHSCTMVKTSRSRRQLIEGRILPKWDGTPLISGDHQPVKPRKKGVAKKKNCIANSSTLSTPKPKAKSENS